MSNSAPLAGIRVLDVSSAFMVPYCSLILAQLGADVIKIESPDGDIIRTVGPSRSHGMGATFMACNDGKRSIAIDLRAEQGQRVLERLVLDADVLVHNLRRPAAERCGLSYENLKRHNPKLVLAAAHGFASGSVRESEPAYDDTIQAASGLASLQGIATGRPTYITSIIGDKTTGLAAVIAILAALRDMEITGVGCEIEIPMFEFMASFTLLEQMVGEVFVPPRGPAVYGRTASPHRTPYATKDGYVSVLLYNDEHWKRFFRVVGRPELATNDAYITISGRNEHIDELYAMVAEYIAGRTTDEWMQVLGDLDVPISRVASIQDLVDDSDGALAHSGALRTATHPSEGEIRRLGLPLRFGGEGLRPPTSFAPRLGQDTRAVLTDLHFEPEEIDDMISSGIAHDGQVRA